VPGHVPPIRDHNGFELAVHKGLADRSLDSLHYVPVPSSWSSPVPYGSRTELREARRREMMPHPSFDVDGDGFVSQQDYRTAKRFDMSGEGILLAGHRKSAIAETCHTMGSRLHDNEIGANARCRQLMTSLREDPQFEDVTKLGTRLRLASTMARSLKMKSSQQLQGCLAFPEPRQVAPSGDEAPPPYTRTMLLQRRREERVQAEQKSQLDFLSTFGPRSY